MQCPSALLMQALDCKREHFHAYVHKTDTGRGWREGFSGKPSSSLTIYCSPFCVVGMNIWDFFCHPLETIVLRWSLKKAQQNVWEWDNSTQFKYMHTSYQRPDIVSSTGVLTPFFFQLTRWTRGGNRWQCITSWYEEMNNEPLICQKDGTTFHQLFLGSPVYMV